MQNNLKFTIESKNGNKYALSVRPRVEININRSVIASLLNRGNDNQTKTFEYGGVLRAYLSSQSIKYAIRNQYSDSKTYRTRKLTYLLKDLFTDDLDKKEVENLKEFLNNCFSSGSENGIMKELHHFTDEEVNKIRNFVIENKSEILEKGKNFESADKLNNFKWDLIMNTPSCLEMSMFGRMDAKGMIREFDGAVSMNMAFSVDSYKSNFDDFIANENVNIMNEDIHKWGENRGAAHMNSNDLNSNELYYYSNIDLGILIDNLCVNRDLSDKNEQKKVKELAIEGVTKFIEDYITVMPTAHQHDKATYELPNCVFITVSDAGKPVSYGRAFEKAVTGYERKSVAENAQNKLIEKIVGEKFNRTKYDGRYFISDIGLTEEQENNLSNKSIDTKSSLDEIIENIINMINNIEFICEE